MFSDGENKPPILHVLVIGFHHKLGCQVEFSYPPLIAGTSGRDECPSGWKYLPTLALPDGSHNFVEDTVFFNLPSLLEPTESIYGVSCYRQIPVEKLKIRTADVTRSTVQKSVCILARLPIYGYIEVKLSLIADAFFDQGDFSCTELLVKAYQQLNACLLDDETRRPLKHSHVGLPLREIVLNWRHKTLILFKLFLLQRRVICFGSPVRDMCVLILGIASLIPRLLEKGFQEVACVRTSRPLSPMPDFSDSLQHTALNVQESSCPAKVAGLLNKTSSEDDTEEYALISPAASVGAECCTGGGDVSPQITNNLQSKDLNLTYSEHRDSIQSGEGACVADCKVLQHQRCVNGRRNSLTREASVDTLVSTLATLCTVNPDEYRAPISIFASGNLCLPYLSLPYMDLLSDPSVLSYIIGTSNVLFQQKRQLADVLIDIETCNIEIHDVELRRQLMQTTEDLRYMDYLLKHVQTPKKDAEGSEYWIREQFQGYILALLRTTVVNDSTTKDIDHFNGHYINAFKRTQCYQEWFDVRPEPEFFDALPAGHPFAGTLSVADMKLKIAQTMQNSESGRKLNQAVNTTSRAVGGAISQAKGAFSSWWSSITTAPPTATAQQVNGYNCDPQTNDTAAEDIDDIQQKMSVTFQNNFNKNDLNICDVSVHLTSGIKMKAEHNCGNSSPTRQIESAEELEEEREPSFVIQEQQQQPKQHQHCIVEIGKEAELLDKDAQQLATMASQHNHSLEWCDTVEAITILDRERECSDVFIV